MITASASPEGHNFLLGTHDDTTVDIRSYLSLIPLIVRDKSISCVKVGSRAQDLSRYSLSLLPFTVFEAGPKFSKIKVE
jgi:hypothetical protein